MVCIAFDYLAHERVRLRVLVTKAHMESENSVCYHARVRNVGITLLTAVAHHCINLRLGLLEVFHPSFYPLLIECLPSTPALHVWQRTIVLPVCVLVC